MSEAVRFSENPLGNGKRYGQATLNVPGSLNAISLDMVSALYEQLLAWQSDDDIAWVLLDAEGDKAFCAGGDIVELYQSMVDAKGADNPYAESFFSGEYRLDYLIHRYQKPIICWGHGIVMGGGVGLMSGCRHRVVTERSRIAMPEITIGLFPDVGSSYFLARMPGKTGLFTALSGANMNAADALFVGLGDRFVTHEQKQAVLDALTEQSWADSAHDNEVTIDRVLARFEQSSQDQLPASAIREQFDLINQLCGDRSVETCVDQLLAFDTDDKWFSRAKGTLAKGCPTTMKLVGEQIQRARHLSLAGVFRMELNLAVSCCAKGDFQEGVRALLIDKDGAPSWRYPDVHSVPEEEVLSHFESRWADHPLQDLQEDV